MSLIRELCTIQNCQDNDHLHVIRVNNEEEFNNVLDEAFEMYNDWFCCYEETTIWRYRDIQWDNGPIVPCIVQYAVITHNDFDNATFVSIEYEKNYSDAEIY